MLWDSMQVRGQDFSCNFSFPCRLFQHSLVAACPPWVVCLPAPLDPSLHAFTSSPFLIHLPTSCSSELLDLNTFLPRLQRCPCAHHPRTLPSQIPETLRAALQASDWDGAEGKTSLNTADSCHLKRGSNNAEHMGWKLQPVVELCSQMFSKRI